jgi:hypothetical protein
MVVTANIGLPASIELNSTKPDATGYYEHVVVGRKQSRIVVVYYSDQLRPFPALAKSIAQEQYGRL